MPSRVLKAASSSSMMIRASELAHEQARKLSFLFDTNMLVYATASVFYAKALRPRGPA